MTTDQIHEAALRCGCSDAEMALCFFWMDDHGAPCEWDAKIEADYKEALDALKAVAS